MSWVISSDTNWTFHVDIKFLVNKGTKGIKSKKGRHSEIKKTDIIWTNDCVIIYNNDITYLRVL